MDALRMPDGAGMDQGPVGGDADTVLGLLSREQGLRYIRIRGEVEISCGLPAWAPATGA